MKLSQILKTKFPKETVDSLDPDKVDWEGLRFECECCPDNKFTKLEIIEIKEFLIRLRELDLPLPDCYYKHCDTTRNIFLQWTNTQNRDTLSLLLLDMVGILMDGNGSIALENDLI